MYYESPGLEFSGNQVLCSCSSPQDTDTCRSLSSEPSSLLLEGFSLCLGCMPHEGELDPLVALFCCADHRAHISGSLLIEPDYYSCFPSLLFNKGF